MSDFASHRRGGPRWVLLAALAALSASCGDSSPTDRPAAAVARVPPDGPTTSASSTSRSRTAAGPSDGSRASTRRATTTERRRKPKIREGNSPTRASHPVSDEEAEAKPVSRSDPCRLVTRSEAAAIIGGRVLAPEVGALGPTCIYRTPRAARLVTLAVHPMDVSAYVARSRRDVVRATVAGRKAYCVNLGDLKLLVPLAGGDVLNIDAPCPIAGRFAAKALSRLDG